jgi:heptosyltransferase I
LANSILASGFLLLAPNKLMNVSPKFLIIRLSSLGDILHALPAFQDLRNSFPNSQIDWLVAKKCAHLLSIVRGINAIHAIDTTQLLQFPIYVPAWRQINSLIRSLRAQRYDFALDFQGLLKTAILGCLSHPHTRIGFSKGLVREPPAQWFYHRKLMKQAKPLHVFALNQLLAELAGAKRSLFSPLDLVAPEADEHAVNSLIDKERLDSFIVINPGGGWATKRWRPERYGALAARIQQELKLQVVVTTGPGEEGLYSKIAEHCCRPAPHHFPVSFIQLIPLLKKAILFIAGDTGPFHLACATGTPVVGIFGPTSPVRNGPWRDGDEAVTRVLPCSSCHKRACTAADDCMDISVDDVMAAVRRRLSRITKYIDL